MITSESNPVHAYDFAAPISLHWPGVDSHLLLDILRTRGLNRLRGISFLGGIDYLFVRSPNGVQGNRRYSRYQHSLGVARLASFHGRLVDATERELNLACVAALLHDVGHAPLSHSLEPVFRQEYDIDHHLATKLIITGDSPFGPEVKDVLLRYKIDPEEVIAVISGQTNVFGGFFSGPINFDTIEGITRLISYQRSSGKSPGPERIVEAATLRSEAIHKTIVDSFWEMKDHAYRTVINSRQGVLADLICQNMFKANLKKFRRSSYFLNETQLFKLLPKLRKILTAQDFEQSVSAYFEMPIEYRVRRFFVDEKGSFDRREDFHRYRQAKLDRSLVAGGQAELNEGNETKDLFPNAGH